MAWFFGSDSDTPSNPCGNDFYMGREGYGTTPSELWTLPSGSTEKACPYWNIVGPTDRPSGTTPTQWGRDQAAAFWTYYSHHGIPSGTGLLNLFGSISRGSGGWTAGNYGPNRSVVDGFLNELHTLSASSGKRLGLYGAQTFEFQTLLDASSWSSPQPIVVWIAVPYEGTPRNCSGVESAYCPMPTVGGYFPMIWQYHQVTPDDYDITPYEGFKTNGYWTPTDPPGIC